MTTITEVPAASLEGMVRPGRSRGLLDVWSRRYLLSLLVRKDTQIRYRDSVLGWIWSYIKPLAQFVVYFVAMGMFLGLNRSMPNYPIYLFSGLVVMNYFNEAFSNATRSILDNGALVKKIYLPRELFPVSSVIIAFVNFFPQFVVLFGACLIVGWQPRPTQVLALLLSVAVVTVLATGLGLIFGAINVGLRDAQNIVDLITMFAMWLSPVLYSINLVEAIAPHWVLLAYNLNPLTGAVRLMHFGMWAPTTTQRPEDLALIGSDGILLFGAIALAASFVIMAIGEVVFRRMESSFAQDL